MYEEIGNLKQEYEPPKLHKHGTVKDLTLATVSGGGGGGPYVP